MALLGERCWPLAVLLYLPQGLFLLPMIVLLPAAWLGEVGWKGWIILIWVLIIFFWHDPFHFGSSTDSGARHLTVITNNYGQNHRLPIQTFIDQEDPDFVVLQDAFAQSGIFQRNYPDRTVKAVSQFILISKYPVEAAQLLPWPLWRGQPVAAEFTIDWQGRDLAIYSVHLPTPRTDFVKLVGLGLVKELAGRNRRKSDGMSFSEAMEGRVELARILNGILAREQRPFIVAGDFNMSSSGYEHSVMNQGLTDCFAKCGRGFGFTFPCDTGNPLTRGKPWLRLDYVFAGPGWTADECRVETGRRSQHRAVVARLSLN